MQRGSRRAHHDRAVGERDFIRQGEQASGGHLDELGVTAVAMFADHLHCGAELLVAAATELAHPAMCEVMDADAVAEPKRADIASDLFYDACDFMPRSYRQIRDR